MATVCRTPRSVAEVAARGDRASRRRRLPTAASDLGVAHRAAGLDERGHAGVEEHLGAVREREERVRRRDRAARRRPGRAGAPAFSTACRQASTRLIWPEPSPTSRPSRTSTIAFDDDAADEAPGEVEVGGLRRRSAARDVERRHVGRVVEARSSGAPTRTAPPAVRTEPGSRPDRAIRPCRRRRRPRLRVDDEAQVRLGGEDRERRGLERGRDDDLEEQARERRSRASASTGRVSATTPPNAALGIAGERGVPGLEERRAARRRRTGSCA